MSMYRMGVINVHIPYLRRLLMTSSYTAFRPSVRSHGGAGANKRALEAQQRLDYITLRTAAWQGCLRERALASPCA